MNNDRIGIVRKIDDLLDSHCKACETKTEYNRQYGGNATFITHYCSKCPIGIQLEALGRELSGTVRPRKKIILEVEDNMAKFKMTAEEYFAERANGKTIAQIAKEQGVSEATIYNHMDKWAKEGKVPGPTEEPEQLDKAEREIERLTAEVAKVTTELAAKEEAKVVAQLRMETAEEAAVQLRKDVERWKSKATEAVALSGQASAQLIAERDAMASELERWKARAGVPEALEWSWDKNAEPDPVNHPAHYTAGAIECIDAIESVLGAGGHSPAEAYLTGQVIKYLWRWKNKNGTEDLRKAEWYLQRLIGTVEAVREA